MLITSQHHIDPAIVADKMAAEDYEVFVSPAFEIDGISCRVILDGHHSFAAAREAGVAPMITECTAREHDAISLLEAGEIEAFLEAVYMDGDYINAETDKAIF